MSVYKIELSNDLSLFYSATWECQTCQGHHYFASGDDQPVCVMCEFKRGGRDVLTIQGWNITKTAHQVVACRVPSRKKAE